MKGSFALFRQFPIYATAEFTLGGFQDGKDVAVGSKAVLSSHVAAEVESPRRSWKRVEEKHPTRLIAYSHSILIGRNGNTRDTRQRPRVFKVRYMF